MPHERHQQIMELFDGALECPAAERVAWLDEHCAADAELRRAVEKMLAANARCSPAFLQESAIEIQARQLALTDQPLEPGATLAQFTIMAPLGAGAMGDVYLARDTRLNRKVALKVLPTRFTWDASRLRRFEREARSASALNHQNIITIYDFGAAETETGTRYFIAAEYVEGVTLRTKLKDGALPIAEALDIAQQIAAALSAAHAAGIIHRDIKPENVMLRPDGVVKVLDFGIAKLTETSESDSHVSHRSTEQGTVIGTPGYMSPEQARGQDVDARTDIFSLGVVLYEMLSGQLPFLGTTNADVIVALLEREPQPLTAIMHPTFPELEHFIHRLLMKNSEARLSSVREVFHLLQALQNNTYAQAETRFVEDRPPAQRNDSGNRWKMGTGKIRQHKKLTLLACLLVVCSALALAWYGKMNARRSSPSFAQAGWKALPAVSRKVGTDGQLSRVFFSPDGQWIAYSLRNDQRSSIWIKNLATEAAQQLTDGNSVDVHPIWLAGGQRLAFASNRDNKNGLWSIPITGGAPTLLCELSAAPLSVIGWGGEAGRERIYFISNSDQTLQSADLQSQQVTPLTQVAAGSLDHSLSPDKQRLAFAKLVAGTLQIYVQSLQDGSLQQVTSGEGNHRFPVWFPDNRTLAYSHNRFGIYQVYLLDLTNQQTAQITLTDNNLDLSDVSSDGVRLIGKTRKLPANVWSVNLRTGQETEQTAELGTQIFPVPSPSGKEFVYLAAQDEGWINRDLFTKSLTTLSLPVKLTVGLGAKWSPDGKDILFLRRVAGNMNLWIYDLNNKAERPLVTGDVMSSPSSFVPYYFFYDTYNWSPDGNQVAYCVRNPDDSNLWIISKDGAHNRSITQNAQPKMKFYSPVWSSENDLAYCVDTYAAGEKNKYQIGVYRQGEAEIIYRGEYYHKLLGWSLSNQEVLVVSGLDTGKTQQVKLFRVNLRQGHATPIAELPSTYIASMKLSPDRRWIAFVSRREGKDNLEVMPVTGESARKLGENANQEVFYSELNWAYDSQTLFFSKQTSWVAATVLERMP